MSKIKDFLRNSQRWSFITLLYKKRLRVIELLLFDEVLKKFIFNTNNEQILNSKSLFLEKVLHLFLSIEKSNFLIF